MPDRGGRPLSWSRDRFPLSYWEAELALRMQKTAIGGPERITVFDDLGIYKILATAGDTSAMERFVTEWLGPLIDYDAEHSTPLVLTLSEYLDFSGGNYERLGQGAVGPPQHDQVPPPAHIRQVSGHDLGLPRASRFEAFRSPPHQRGGPCRRYASPDLRRPWLSCWGNGIARAGRCAPAPGPRHSSWRPRDRRGTRGGPRCASEVDVYAYVQDLEKHLRLTLFGGGMADPEGAMLLVRGALADGDQGPGGRAGQTELAAGPA